MLLSWAVLTLHLAVVSPRPSPVLVARWTTLGVPGGDVMSLLAVPGSATRIYAGTSRGSIYRSDDAGNSWAFLDRLGAPVIDLQIDPNLRTIYALVTSTPERQQNGLPILGSLFRSDDEGKTWERLADAGTFAVDPQHSGTIYRGTYLGPVFKSTNEGQDWSDASPLFSSTTSVIVDSSQPDILYAFTGVLYRTTDGGTLWSRIDSPPGNLRLQIAGRDGPGSVYAVSQGQVHHSTDRGQTWTTTPVSSASTVYQLSGMPAAGGALFAATDRGVFRSDDLGATWAGGDSFSGYPVHAVAASEPSSVYAGAFKGGDGFFRSDDRGSHWSISNAGLLEAAIATIAVDPRIPSRVYAGGQGIFRSDDSGASWITLNQHLRPTVLVIDNTNPASLYVVSDGQVWASHDSGASWAQSSGPPVSVQSLLIDGGGTLYTNGFKSPDGGTHWFVTSGAAYLVAADPSAAGVLYGVAATPGGFSSDLFKTVDGALSWQGPVLRGMLLETIGNVAVAPGHVVYAAKNFNERQISSGSLFLSRDQGITWVQVFFRGGFGIGALAPDPIRSGVLYLSVSSSLYALTPSGAVSLLAQGLSPAKLAVAPDASRIYAVAASQLETLPLGVAIPTPKRVPFR